MPETILNWLSEGGYICFNVQAQTSNPYPVRATSILGSANTAMSGMVAFSIWQGYVEVGQYRYVAALEIFYYRKFKIRNLAFVESIHQFRISTNG